MAQSGGTSRQFVAPSWKPSDPGAFFRRWALGRATMPTMNSSLHSAQGPAAAVTGLVLAGGLGRRMGGLVKGLVPLAGRPMIEHVLAALRPQVREVWINSNRNQERYGAYGHPVIGDRVAGYLGPLAGVLGALERLQGGFLLTVPCDAPLLAPDLAARLHAACVEAGADLAVASDGARQHPVFLLLQARL